MTDTLTPLLDARHAAEFGGDEFTEAEMNAIDAAAVHVYKKAHAILPPDLIDRSRTGSRKSDPAGAIRAWAYEYAYGHPGDIHSRTPGQIVHHMRGRLRQRLKRVLARRVERPFDVGDEFDSRVRKYMAKLAKDDAAKGIHEPRKFPAKYRTERSPVCTFLNADAIDNLGTIPSSDTWQFAMTGHRGSAPVWESSERFAALHTRRPSRAEYWEGVLDGNSHRTARKDLQDDTGMHADTVREIVSDVAPAVSERFSTEARPVDHADVQRQRLEITRQEVRRVLLERFDVLYDD